MKQPKKLTREQKECLSAHYLNCKDWMLVEETEFYYRIIPQWLDRSSDGRKIPDYHAVFSREQTVPCVL